MKKQVNMVVCLLIAGATWADQIVVGTSDAAGNTEERTMPLSFSDGRATFRLDWGSVGASTRQGLRGQTP